MKLTQGQIERMENPPHSQRRKIKDIVVQYRSDPDKSNGNNRLGSIFEKLCEDWSTRGKYEKIEDAVKALETISKQNNIFTNLQYRVLIKKQWILKEWATPHDLAEQLKKYCEENNYR